MPSAWHRWAFLDQWSLSYTQKASRTLSFFGQIESVGSCPLGLVGSAGFLLLLIVGLAGSTWVRRRSASLANCAQLTVALVLFAVVGGFSEIIAIHITIMIRAYNRISIALLFLSLFALGIVFDQVFQTRRPAVRSITLCLLTILALLDQVPTGIVPDYTQDKSAFQRDRRFVQEIEDSLPTGSSIMQLPAVWFPEVGILNQMEDYDHLRGFLHSGRITVELRSRARAVDLPVAAGSRGDASSRDGLAAQRRRFLRDLHQHSGIQGPRAKALLEQLRMYLGTEPLVGGAKGELRFFRLPAANAEKTPGGRVS